jgi:hypothetical protein
MNTTYITTGVWKSLVLLLMFAFAGCSTMEEDNNDGATFATSAYPEWNINQLLMGNDPVPDWIAPDPSNYESSMFIMVQLQEELVRYSTDADCMTVFIGNECRATPSTRSVSKSGNIYFVLKIRGNNEDRNVNFSLCYYCAKLHKIFSLTDNGSFATERTYGVDEEFEPQFLKGATKYPIISYLDVTLQDNPPFTPSIEDEVAVFVGDECRGTGRVGKKFSVLSNTDGENMQVRYYSKEKNGVYTFNKPVVINKNTTNKVTLTF